MRIAVVGTGGVGGYFGGRLAQAGEDVVFIARGATLSALRESGLRVESADGDFTIQPAQATDEGIGVRILRELRICKVQRQRQIINPRPLAHEVQVCH